MPDTDASVATARRGARGLLWAGLLIAWVTLATAGIVLLAFQTVSPDEGSSATPATVTNLVPAPLATVPLAPVPVISVPSAPAVPPTVTLPVKHPRHQHVAAPPARHVGAVHTVHTVHTVTATTSGPGTTTASGPAGRTPLPNNDPGTTVVVVPVTKNGGAGSPAKPVTPAGGHPVKVTGVGTTTDTSGEPSTIPVVPPVLLPGNGNGNGNGNGSTPTTPAPGTTPPSDGGSGTTAGGDTDPVTPPSDDSDDSDDSDGPGTHRGHHDHGHGHHGHHGHGSSDRGDDSD